MRGAWSTVLLDLSKFLVLWGTSTLGLTVFAPATGFAQDEAWRMDDPLVEVESFDSPEARIQRFALTARNAPVREVPIPESQNLFCTLGQDHNVILNYYPDIDTWAFQVDASDSARRAAGGIATCLNLNWRETP